MFDTAATNPASLVQSRTPFRAGVHATYVAGLGTPTFVHFLEHRAMLNGLVREHRSEGRPACVRDAFRHAGLGKFRGRHIADRDVIELAHDPVRELVQEVPARTDDARVDVGCLPLFPGALCFPELCLKRAEVTRVIYGFACGQGSKALEAQVDTNALVRLTRNTIWHFDTDIQEPVSPRVAREVGAIFDLRASGQGTALEHLELAAVKVKSVRRLLDIAPFERHPTKRLLVTAPTQVWALLLTARFGVLLAHIGDSAGVQRKFFAATSRELDQVEAGMPAPAKTQCVFLTFVAEVPDEIDRPRLLVQQPIQGLDAVSVDEDHGGNSTLVCSPHAKLSQRETQRFAANCTFGLRDKISPQAARRRRHQVDASALREGLRDDGGSATCAGWRARPYPLADRISAEVVDIGDGQRFEGHIKSSSAARASGYRRSLLERRAVVAFILRRQRGRCAPGKNQGICRSAACLFDTLNGTFGAALYLLPVTGRFLGEF